MIGVNMDERLEKALEFSNYMTTLNNQRRILKEVFYEDLVYFQNGCQFTVTKELITFVNMLISTGNDTDITLVDDNDIPTKIQDLNVFFENILDLYFKSSNKYLTEYDSLKKMRNVEKLIDYE